MSDTLPLEEVSPPSNFTSQLSGAERAAVILALLDPETAKDVAEKFEEGAAERAVAAFEGLKMVAREDLLSTIGAFVKEIDGTLPIVAGGRRRAGVLARALAGVAEPLIEPPELPNEGSLDEDADAEAIWTYLRGLEPPKLAFLIKEERPAVIAAVLQRIDRQAGALVLEQLPDESAIESVRLMIKGRQPAPRTYEAIAESLRRTAPGRLAEADDPVGDPTDQLAEVFNCMMAARQDLILDPLRDDMPEETKRLEDKLLRFEILNERLPKTVVPQIFREVDKTVLDPALKHGLEHQNEAAEFLLSCISQRLAEQIRERLDEMRTVPKKDGETAQTSLVRTLISWADEGRFQFKLPPEAEDAD